MGGIILDDLKNGALYIGTIPSSMDNNRCSVTLEMMEALPFISMRQMPIK